MSKPLQIFYADDDEDDHIFFREALSAMPGNNCSVISAYDGSAVIERLRCDRYSDFPDLLILDLNMPMIDGFGILEQMRKNRDLKQIPVYILSVSDKEHDRKRCLELGCKEFYTKPVNFKMLSALIKSIIENHSVS